MKKGFTMIELLVVIGILGVLMAVLVTGFKDAPEKAEIAKCQQLVSDVKLALDALFNEQSFWPGVLIANNNSTSGLDEKAAYPIAKALSLTADDQAYTLRGNDRFGIVSPWAATVIKNRGTSCTKATRVPIGGTINDHVVCYALDLDGDGKIEGVKAGGQTVDVRGTSAVWCRGPKGKLIKTWTDGDTREVR